MTPWSVALCAALGLGSVFCPGSRASAQATEEVGDDQARWEFNAGRDAYNHQDYEEAARRFEQSYELSQRPQLLYNLGMTYDQLHRWREAREAFQRYLVAFPDAPERSDVMEKLELINAQILREEDQSPNSQQQQPAAGTAGQVQRTERPKSDEDSHPFRITGFIAGGLAVASGAGSLVLTLLSNKRYDDLAASCGRDLDPRGCPESDIRDLEQRANMINALLGIAIGLGVTSAAGFVIDALTHNGRPTPAQTSRSKTPRLQATFTPVTTLSGGRPFGGSMFSLSGVF